MHRRKTFGIILTVFLVILGGAFWFFNGVVAPKGAGFHAKVMCSDVFVSGRSPDSIRGVDLKRFWFAQGTVNQEKRTVTSSVYGLATTTAVYRGGLGCTLANGTTVKALRNNPPEIPTTNRNPEDQLIKAQLSSTVRDRLDRAVSRAFREPYPNRPRNTRAMVVLHHGKIVAERYADEFNKAMPITSWSMTKSITGTLLGMAAARGELDLEAPAPIDRWQEADDPRRKITVENLLHMSSGLAFDESYDLFGEAPYMLFVAPSTAGYAIRKPLVHPPGTHWKYSSGTSNILSYLLRQTLGHERYYRFPYEQLFQKIGMTSVVMEPDPSGTFVGSSFMYASPRDWARFGQLYLQDGTWNGEQILPEDWVEYATTPAPAAPKGQYGAQIWLNQGREDHPEDRPFPQLPRSLYRFSGFEGQEVMVFPSRDAVIVRMGMTPDESALDQGPIAADILEALPGN